MRREVSCGISPISSAEFKLRLAELKFFFTEIFCREAALLPARSVIGEMRGRVYWSL